MKDEKPRKTRSFARRLTWRIILILTFINLLVVGAVLFFVFVGMFVQGEMRSRDLINLISGKMDTMLTSVEVSAANNVGELEKHLDSPEQVFGVLEKELESGMQRASKWRLESKAIGRTLISMKMVRKKCCAAIYCPFATNKVRKWVCSEWTSHWIG